MKNSGKPPKMTKALGQSLLLVTASLGRLRQTASSLDRYFEKRFQGGSAGSNPVGDTLTRGF